MKISDLRLEVIRFGNEDVIATSLYFTSAATYNSLYGTNFTGDYVQFNGEMTTFDPDQNAWLVSNARAASVGEGTMEENIEFAKMLLSWGPSWSDFYKDYYNAYEYNGNLYTKGVNYTELYGNQ